MIQMQMKLLMAVNLKVKLNIGDVVEDVRATYMEKKVVLCVNYLGKYISFAYLY